MWLLFGLLLSFISVSAPAAATSSRFDFVLEETTLTVDFAPLALTPAAESTTTELKQSLAASPRFLSFDYRLDTEVIHDPDTILLLLVANERVLYALPAAAVSSTWQTLTLDIATLGLQENTWPLFYINQALGETQVKVNKVRWLSDLSGGQVVAKLLDPSITELHAIREADESLTLLLSIDDDQWPNTYRLDCLGVDLQVVKSVDLVDQYNFFWSSWPINWLRVNLRNELIFHLDSFACANQVRVSSGTSFSPAVDILDWNSYAAN